MTTKRKCTRKPCRIQSHHHFLSYLSVSSPPKRKLLVRSATSKEIQGLSDLVFNLASNTKVKLNATQRSTLKRHRNRILQLITTPSIPKRRTLLQHGGFLQAVLLPIVASAVVEAGTSLINSLFKINENVK